MYIPLTNGIAMNESNLEIPPSRGAVLGGRRSALIGGEFLGKIPTII